MPNKKSKELNPEELDAIDSRGPSGSNNVELSPEELDSIEAESRAPAKEEATPYQFSGWENAIKDELAAPFTGTRAGRPVPDSVSEATKSMGLLAGATGASPNALSPAGQFARQTVTPAAGNVIKASIPIAKAGLKKAGKGLLYYMGAKEIARGLLK